MSNRIFQDLNLEAQFQRQGYVRLPLLTADEVAEVNETLQEFALDEQLRARMPFYVSIFDSDQQCKKKCRDIFLRIAPRLDRILYNYRFVMGNLFCKFAAGEELNMHDHQDSCDESKYTSISVWIPLLDTNEQNGTLEIIEGSHKIFPFISHWNAPMYFQDFARSLIDNHCKPTNAHAGEGIIFCDKLIHYSGPNLTKITRSAIQLRFLPNAAPFLFYHLDRAAPEKGFEVYECSEKFYEQNTCNIEFLQQRPSGLVDGGQLARKCGGEIFA